MENKIKLTPPDGWEIDLEKSSLITGEIVYKEKKRLKLPLQVSGYYVSTHTGEIEHVLAVQTNNIDFNLVYPTKELCEASIALAKLIWYRDLYNEGWIADWKDTNSNKFIIYFYKEKKDKSMRNVISHVLNFKTPEIRDKFSKDFDELIHIAKPLL